MADKIHRDYVIRYRPRSGTFAVLEPHSDFIFKQDGLVSVEAAKTWIDAELTRIELNTPVDLDWYK